MSESLQEFLVALADDGVLLARFRVEPGPVLDEAGLVGEAREALLSRDLDRIRALLPPGYSTPMAIVSAPESSAP
jgi:hypothetical protein